MSATTIKQQCLTILNDLENIDVLQEVSGVLSETQHFRGRLEDDEFRIAVVGEYSSGKSTFINAILGKDILTHAATETTAAVTRIVNVSKSDPRRNTGVVLFSNGNRVPLTGFDKLRDYTAKGSDQYDVVNEISAVELYVSMFESSHKIVLIDTPGLNGIAEGHRDRTVQLVQQAHACIYLLQLRGLSESDVSFIRYLAGYQKTFVFVQNFIDEFKLTEGDNTPAKIAEQRKILEQQVFSETDASYSICGVSALMALTYADKSIPSLYNGSPLLTPDARKKLYEASNFKEFQSILADTFQEDQLDRIQYQDTAAMLCRWIKSLAEQIERQARQTREVYEASADRWTIAKSERLREKELSGQGKHEEYLSNFVVSSCNKIRQDASNSLKRDLEQIKDNTFTKIKQFKSIEELEPWSNTLSAELLNNIGRTTQKYGKRCTLELQSLYQTLLRRIEEYSGIHSESLSVNSMEIRLLDQPTQQLSRETQITKFQQKQANKTKTAEELLREQAENAKEQREEEYKQRQYTQQKESLARDTTEEITRIGKRPDVKKRDVPYTDYVPHGGFGIWDCLFGPKEVTCYKTVTDDAAAKAWDAAWAKIQNEKTQKVDELNRKLSAAQRAADRAQQKSSSVNQRYQEIQKDIANCEADIAMEQKVLEEEKKHAAQEYLVKCQTNLMQQVNDYLLSGENSVLHQITEDIDGKTVAEEGKFSEWTIERFRHALLEKLARIEEACKQECPELLQKANGLGDICKQMLKMVEVLEAIK